MFVSDTAGQPLTTIDVVFTSGRRLAVRPIAERFVCPAIRSANVGEHAPFADDNTPRQQHLYQAAQPLQNR